MAAAPPEPKRRFERLLNSLRDHLEEGWPEDGRLDDSTAEQLARLAARDVVGKYLWLSALGEVCDSREIATRLGVNSRQAVQARYRRGTLLGVEQSGRIAFPAWQLDPSGRPYPVMIRVIRAFRAEGITDPWVIVSWFATSQDDLDGSTPLEWMRQGRPMLALERAAAQTAYRLAA
jgi:hypothetical protein